MNVAQEGSCWRIVPAAGKLTRIEIGYRLGLLFSDPHAAGTLWISTSFNLNLGTKVLDIDPEQTMALSPVLNIFGASVESIYIDAEGRLEMTLGGNDKITINPHKLYEAWELGLPDIFTLLVCVPGGRVTVFQKDKE